PRAVLVLVVAIAECGFAHHRALRPSGQKCAEGGRVPPGKKHVHKGHEVGFPGFARDYRGPLHLTPTVRKPREVLRLLIHNASPALRDAVMKNSEKYFFGQIRSPLD